jgi:two-component system CheB/CheR fusion protein
MVSGVAGATPGGGSASFDVQLCPLTDDQGLMLGVSVSFEDTTGVTRMRRDLEHANQELETAYEELQSTNEELETTNEELQSTVEELETTNEELQSTNEELETMNEELQSTNEELQTINDAMRGRGEELNDANSFLASFMSSLGSAVVVLDRELRVLAWNGHATELWGVRADETVARNFFGLDIGLPFEQLHVPIRRCLAGESSDEQLMIEATNRRGRSVHCAIRCLPLADEGNLGAEVRGVILLMDNTAVQDTE